MQAIYDYVYITKTPPKTIMTTWAKINSAFKELRENKIKNSSKLEALLENFVTQLKEKDKGQGRLDMSQYLEYCLKLNCFTTLSEYGKIVIQVINRRSFLKEYLD